MSNDTAQWKTSCPLKLTDWEDSSIASGMQSGNVILYIPTTGDVHLITRAASKVLKALDGKIYSALELFDLVCLKGGVDLGVKSASELMEVYLYPFEGIDVIEQVL